jgi:hypothetical protein
MAKIIETEFGTRINPANVAAGSASSIKKAGAFYVFSLRISANDIREYSFTNFDRALHMRKILISHVEQKILLDKKSRASK